MVTPHLTVLVIGMLALTSLANVVFTFHPQGTTAMRQVEPTINTTISHTPVSEIIPTATATPIQILPASVTTISWSPKPLSEYQELMNFCSHGQSDSDLWRTRLNQVTFPSDVTFEAQKRLSAQVIIYPSCNYEMQNYPLAIVLHYTEGPLEATISTFQTANNTSAHYIIDRDGEVYQIVPEQFAAYHVSCYGSRNLCLPSCPICDDTNGNQVEPRTQSIGIELVNQGHVNPEFFDGEIYEDFNVSFGYRYWEQYSDEQLNSLEILVEDIRTRWEILPEMVIGHSRVNNNTDPGPALFARYFTGRFH